MGSEERLAVLETLVSETRSDVSEVKVDVKKLLERSHRQVGMLSFVQNVAPWVALALALVSMTGS